MARAFNVCREGNRLVIRCDQLEGFINCAEPPDDPIAVERICDAMNTGFWLGYSLGETDAQANMRRALGLKVESPCQK